jgi:tetratricopeptide (TPR) repeat protein
LAIQLEGLTSEIADLLQLFRQPRVYSYVALNDANSHAMTNLSVCVASAQELVSTASRIVSGWGIVPDDRISNIMDFTDQRRSEISSWIPKPATSEDFDRPGSDRPSESIGNGTNFDREHVNIQTLFKFATLAYRAQKYEEAIALLQKFRIRSEARYGPHFENRNELLGMLVITHCRLREWEKAAEEIAGIDFEGREEAVKTLVWCYCEDQRWDDAEKLLCETMESENERDTDTNEALAEIYIGKGDYDKAIRSCDNILQIVGEDHIQFYLSLSLLAQIYEAKGDAIEAKLHRDLLPPGIEGFSLSQSANQQHVMTLINYLGCGQIKRPWRWNRCYQPTAPNSMIPFLGMRLKRI